MSVMSIVFGVALPVIALARTQPLPREERPWLSDELRDDPNAQADAVIAKMTLEEKIAMLHGTHNGYVGNVVGNDRLGIPPLNLNDGPQGFRDGGSTAWPSGMTVGMTWDASLAYDWGAAMGAEFFGKGANVQLGPGLCVARVPRNGRNFEYLSGEDPFLGYKLVQPVIKGIQSQKVIANAKHYIMNNQETQRGSINEEVDERTRFEMYYPPFEGASIADVGSVMCSYNKINGYWSCENNETLALDFKQRIGFKGWVMSDWGATHSTSINAGLDQEMPGAAWMNNQSLQAMLADGTLKVDKINDSVHRMLRPMFQYGIFDTIDHWKNTSNHNNDVTSPEHSRLARNISAAASVVLKNKDNILPLKAKSKIALIGSQAKIPTVSGGGSGHVTPTYVIDPFTAISTRNSGIAPPPPAPRPPMNCSYENDTDYYHLGDHGGNADSKEDCCKQCYNTAGCIAFTFLPSGGDKTWPEGHEGPLKERFGSNCWFHTEVGIKSHAPGKIAGHCGPPVPTPAPGTDGISYDDGSSTSSAAKVAAAADIAIVFVSTSSHEGSDRASLSYDGNADDLVSAVAAAQKKTIVVGISPGAVLMPWSDNVAAIVNVWMPGLEFGHALSDILYGDVNPSGRLTLTMPNVENEIGFKPENWPGVNGSSLYSEKLNIGYRWYDSHKVTPKFPFGHGLSYTQFEYSNLVVHGYDVSVDVKNVGPVDGSEVVQLYLEFPQTAEEPPMQLKQFSKVFIKKGYTTSVQFNLDDRAFSIWSTNVHAWAVVQGTFIVRVGASSRDIRQSSTIQVPKTN